MASHLAPQAQQMDQNSDALFNGFRMLGDRNLLALRLNPRQGGQGWDEPAYSEFQILIASYSGALAFLSTQHQSALRMVSQSSNETMKQKLLSALIRGNIGMGVGFSQLRRAGQPMMTATPTETGYLLSGVVPWVTGFGCFEGFICGARLPTQDILMGWVPLLCLTDDPRYTVSLPMDLTAMASTQTVEVRLTQWQMQSTEVIAIHDREWLRQKDQSNTLHHGFYALGAAKAALHLMQASAPPFDLTIRDAIASFEQQYHRCKARMLELLPCRLESPNECLQAKADVIRLAGCCAQAAIAMAGGSANHPTHPAQRIYREVLAFTVFGQTTQSKQATLAALSSG